jgi:hypothetical protein
MGLHGLTPYEKLKGVLGDNKLLLDKISNFGIIEKLEVQLKRG